MPRGDSGKAAEGGGGPASPDAFSERKAAGGASEGFGEGIAPGECEGAETLRKIIARSGASRRVIGRGGMMRGHPTQETKR